MVRNFGTPINFSILVANHEIALSRVAENQEIYSKADVVEAYSKKNDLTLPERTLLSVVKEKKVNSMLDIGVGAGRTCLHFAPIVQKYTGLDYVEEMILVCRKRFQSLPHCAFVHSDARNMFMFEEASFDLVLFSFNGIDCVNYQDRLKIFSEIKRLLKPGGLFIFSSHNVYNMERLFSFQWPKNPFSYLSEYKRMKGVRLHNPPLETLLSKDVVDVIDGDQQFKTSYIYVKPAFQIKQLSEQGYTNLETYSLVTGKKLPLNSRWENIEDAWIYYTGIKS